MRTPTSSGPGTGPVSIEPLDPDDLRAVLAAADIRRIQFGCGPQLVEGWLNVDLGAPRGWDSTATRPDGLYRVNGQLLFHRIDATRPLPYADGQFACAYAEHFIEHIEREAAVSWLAEVRRVVAPTGLVRLTTPDLERYVRGYLELDGARTFMRDHHRRLRAHRKLRDAPQRRAWMFNQLFYRWDHRWIYDFEEIAQVAVEAGFGPDRIRRCGYGEGREAAVGALDLASRSDETLYVEIDA